MSWSVSAPATEYHSLSVLNNKLFFFLIVLKAGQSKTKVQASLVPDESCLPGLQKGIFSLCPHVVERDCPSHVSSYIRLFHFLQYREAENFLQTKQILLLNDFILKFSLSFYIFTINKRNQATPIFCIET